MDRGAWQAAIYGVAKSQTRLSDFTSLLVILKFNYVLCFITCVSLVERYCGIQDRV